MKSNKYEQTKIEKLVESFDRNMHNVSYRGVKNAYESDVYDAELLLQKLFVMIETSYPKVKNDKGPPAHKQPNRRVTNVFI